MLAAESRAGGSSDRSIHNKPIPSASRAIAARALFGRRGSARRNRAVDGVALGRAPRLAAYRRRLWPRSCLLFRFSDRTPWRGFEPRDICAIVAGRLPGLSCASRRRGRASLARARSFGRARLCPLSRTARPRIEPGAQHSACAETAEKRAEAAVGRGRRRTRRGAARAGCRGLAGEARYRAADAALRLRSADLRGTRTEALGNAARRRDDDYRQGP